MEKKLEVKNITISFRTQGGKVQAVRDVSFDLYKGETLAIVGESGSGKSVTNRAIMGILAGNAIVEGGKIIYDGRDLLKISEEEMVKLRGDKIAMIFQDPLSALDPIMKIGKQITEAMLLKNKASRRAGRKEFNEMLAILSENMIQASDKSEESIKKIGEMIVDFDKFNINALKLENAYNEARVSAQELLEYIDNSIFNVERKQKVEVGALYHRALHGLKKMRNDFLTYNFESRIAFAESDITSKLVNLKVNHVKYADQESLAPMREVSLFINEILSQPTPNFFRIGYYLYKKPDEDVRGRDIDELNALCLEFLNNDFMDEFIQKEVEAIKYAVEKSIRLKSEMIAKFDDAIDFFVNGEYTKKQAYEVYRDLSKGVKNAINRLSHVKDSFEYTFATSLKTEIDRYFFALKNNPKEENRFDVQTAKREKLLAKGKKVAWKVVPKEIIDIEEQKKAIASVIIDLKENFIQDKVTAENNDYRQLGVALVDFFKDRASQVVNKVTRSLAKAKALKLMEEVGIPEARIRFNQYPFEFSGGMRQRIVIAIALCANPDILICDEPTTALDVTIQAQILELINKLKAERNLSVIFITHDLGVVANMADRIAVMYAGKIVEKGTADDIFYDPRHPYTWALLSSMPDLDTNEKLDAIPGTPPNMIYPPKGDAFAERNKYAMQIDYELQPPMFEVSPTHSAATWLLHPDAPKVEMPSIIKKRIEKMKTKLGDVENGEQ